MLESLLVLLATYVLHSSLLLGLAWGVDRFKLLRSVPARETLWRVALFGGVFTVLAQSVWLQWPSTDSTLAPIAARSIVADPVDTRPTGSRAQRAGAVRSTRLAHARTESKPAPESGTTTARRTPNQPLALQLPRSPAELSALLIAVWLAGAALAMWVLMGQLRRWSAYWRRLPPCAAPFLQQEAQRLARLAGIAAPNLLLMPDGASPVAGFGGRISLPPWALQLAPDQARALLAHEIAHIERRDPAWRVAIETLARAFWIQPLNRLALRRLEALAEIACDSWSARASGSGLPLAECLANCAERMVAPTAPQWVPAMASPRSALLTRIESLLEETAMSESTPARRARWAALLLLPSIILVLPVVTLAPNATATERPKAKHHHVQISDSLFGGSYFEFEVEDEHGSLSAEIKGKVQFTPAEDDIAVLHDDAEAWIESNEAGTTRRMEFEAAGSAVTRKYFVNGDEQPIDAAAKAWLARIIPTVLRESGFDAEQRVLRIFQRGGADAVLSEVALIGGDYVRRVYLSELVRQGALPPEALNRALGLSAEIRSDFERRTTLVAILEHQELRPAQQNMLLSAVASMQSDFEQRTVLEGIAALLADDVGVRAAWLAAIVTLESDFERRQAITAAMAPGQVHAELVAAAIDATVSMDSSFESRTTLEAIAARLHSAPELAIRYAKAATEIDSDFERRSALIALIEAAPLDSAVFRSVLDAAAGISSNFECAQVLLAAAERMPVDADLIRRYREIARQLSDHERIQAEKALDRFEA